jgi:adenylylsulfate kinase
MYKETTFRSIIKTITWRVWATAITMALVWIFTKKMELVFSIGGLEVTSKLIAYFIHERIWDKINIGRREITADDIRPQHINMENQLISADADL